MALIHTTKGDLDEALLEKAEGGTEDEQIVALLKVICNRLAVIERALSGPPLYVVGEDGVLTRVTDGAQVVPFRGKVR